MTRLSFASLLLGATSLGFGVLATTSTFADPTKSNCDTIYGTDNADCGQANAGTVVKIPRGEQLEPETAPAVNNSGFSISLDGEPVNTDKTIEDKVRRTDIALQQAEVQVSFDSLVPETRLAVETVGRSRAYRAGDTVTLQSETNYPAFITRSEFRIIDRGAVGGPKFLGAVPVQANGQASVQVPAGSDVVIVHRVYDARGRYDETEALPLGKPDDRGLRDDVEELAATTAVRNIRVNGGAVTVSAKNMGQGARLQALGVSAKPDASGGAVIQRILPPGEHSVDVSADGARLRRDITVPGAEWFYVATADLTYERVKTQGKRESRTVGRLQYYVDGELANGVKLTSSLDTGEEELKYILRRLDEKDPRSVLEHLSPLEAFPTYGDDSEIRDATPTSGKFYLKAERDGNHLLWGDYKATVAGSYYLRNERTLYGAHAVYNSRETTKNGDARFAAELYVAQPDQLVGRESFRGTGGSVYFLNQQDIRAGTETLTIEVRDAVTGRVIDRRRLIAGRDYTINPLQGVITLARPLTGSTNNNLIQTNVGGDQVVNLVAQYEYTPTSSDVDGFSYGGRVEGWVNDQVRLGMTLTRDNTGLADQRSTAVDMRYQFSENSFVQLDVAESSGPGFGFGTSLDGGLTISTQAATAGSGLAYRLAGQADLQDLGYARSGVIGAYAEKREAGFSTLDYQVDALSGGETLLGAYARIDKTDTQMGWAVYADLYENNAGSERSEVGVELDGNLSPRLSFQLGAEYLDQKTATTDGSRLDLAGRLTYEANPNLRYSAFVQGTARSDGLDDYNRFGIGVERDLSEYWTVAAELSGGTGGLGGRVLASYANGGNSSYFGYELDTDRSLDAGSTSTENVGKYIMGGRRQINDDVAMYGENTYDVFGDKRTLTSAYGLEYARSEFLTYGMAIELGRVSGSDNADIERRAISFDMQYDQENLQANARLELRRDEAAPGSTANDIDAIFFDTNLRYKINEDQRVLVSVSAADSNSDGSSILNGKYIDASIGYAFRPINNERLNVLARYRFLHDTFGQEVDGLSGARARQESHVFSLEGSYDLSRQWTLGAKVGGRFASTSASESDPWVDNDAVLSIINARYHLVHNWDVLLEARRLDLKDAGISETGVLGAVYRHIGNNAKLGIGYNFTSFSDDLTDLSNNDDGLFINLVAKF